MFSWASVTKRTGIKAHLVTFSCQRRTGKRKDLVYLQSKGEKTNYMKMISNIQFFCLTALVLLNLVGANPMSNLQSLKQLLEEESRLPYYASEEMGVDGKDLNTENIAEEVPPWDSEDARNSALTGKEDVIARLLNDIMTTPKRSWSRFKKGGLRSCFGVRLERIGSFSGLGC
ncbi:C-type natriuretic peptide 3-like [Oncorhynchus nerka]|uniref:C-type natriuretic peptide 3-like n=1 Tax=Oncorhynchus nerka TaxID=8023 RepID=UPI0031B8350A